MGHQLGMGPVAAAELVLAEPVRFFYQFSERTRTGCRMGGLAVHAVELTVEEPGVLHISESRLLEHLESSMKPVVFALRCPTFLHCGSLLCICADLSVAAL